MKNRKTYDKHVESEQPFVISIKGLIRLRDVFKLQPVEFPTARQSPEYLSQNPQARADDINTAFADSSIKGIIATIGGIDQIRILPYIDGFINH